MPQFYRNAAVAIVMCDVTQPKSLQAAKIWKKRVDENVLQPNGQPIPAVLLINKVHYVCHSLCVSILCPFSAISLLSKPQIQTLPLILSCVYSHTCTKHTTLSVSTTACA